MREEVIEMYKSGMPMREVARKFRLGAATVRSYLEDAGVYIRTRSEAVAIPFNPAFNESLGYILGVLKGDGWAGKDKCYGICLTVKDCDFADAFTKALTDVYGGRKPLKPHKNSKGYYTISTRRKNLVNWVRSINPYELLIANKEMARGFLRGFFDSEGSCGCSSKGQSYITASCKDMELVILCADLLDCRFGIECGMWKDFAQSGYSRERIWMYGLCILKRCQSKFLSEIGFSIKRKQVGLR